MTFAEDRNTFAEDRNAVPRSAVPSSDKEKDLTVFYDGSCPLCTVEIDFYASRRGAETIRFVDVSDRNARTGPGLSRAQAMRRFHVRRADGTLVSGAAAFVAIWRRLPGWRFAARVARLPGVVAVLELVYGAFLPVRPLLSRLARKLGARPRRAEGQPGSNSCGC